MKSPKLLVSITVAVTLLAGTVYPQQDCERETARADRAESKLKDWPNLSRYASANETLLRAPRVAGRVVFIGDSITDNWKLDDVFREKPYVNRGIGSQTTPQILLRFRPDVIALKPDAVVLLAGTNDIAGLTGPTSVETIENNLRTMIEMAKSHRIRVVLASVLPISDYHKNAAGERLIRTAVRSPEKILELNRWIKRTAHELDLVYLDYFSALVDERGFFREEFSRDGVHPNAAGYEVMKPLVERAIAAALRRKQK